MFVFGVELDANWFVLGLELDVNWGLSLLACVQCENNNTSYVKKNCVNEETMDSSSSHNLFSGFVW